MLVLRPDAPGDRASKCADRPEKNAEVEQALALVALSGLFSLASATEAGTFAKALEQAKAQNKILVVDFYTDW